MRFLYQINSRDSDITAFTMDSHVWTGLNENSTYKQIKKFLEKERENENGRDCFLFDELSSTILNKCSRIRNFGNKNFNFDAWLEYVKNNEKD